MVRFLAVALVALFTLSACSQDSSPSGATDIAFDQPLAFSGLAPAARSITLSPDSIAVLGFTGSFLYVDADEASTTANNWRFRLAVASSITPIRQVYLDVRDAEDEVSYGAFELCNAETGCNANSLQGWVSGLNPRDLGIEEGATFTLRLVVENTDSEAQVVASTPLSWAPLSLAAPSISLSNNTLSAQWEGIEQTNTNTLLRYNLYVIEGLFPSRSAALDAETNRWQRRLIDGTSTSLTVNAQAITVWVSAVNASGEVAFSNVALLNTTPPSAPTIALVQDTGGVEGITNNGAFTVTGIEDGSLVEYSINGGDTWSTTVPTAIEGANEIYVRQTDAAGNVSASNTLVFTLDTVAPVAPSIAFVEDTGSVAGITSNGNFTAINIEDGAIVEYSTNGNNNWNTAVPTAVEGSNVIRVRQTDGAGNISPYNTLAFTLDTTPPVIAFQSGTLSSNSSTPTISGTLNEPSTVSLTVNSVTYEAESIGLSWSIAVTNPLLDANYSVSVQAVDSAGNASAAVQETLSINAFNPSVSIVLNNLTSDNLINAAESATSIAVSGYVVGDAQEGDAVTISVGSNEYATTLNADLQFSVNVPGSVLAAHTSWSVIVVVTDLIGNSSSFDQARNYQVNATPPSAPTIALVQDTGGVEGITNNGAFTVTGIEDGSLVEYSINGGDTWSTTVPTAIEGVNEIYVRQTDAAGNVSASNTLEFTLDTIPPSLETVTFNIDPVTADNVINGPESSGGATVQISGTITGDVTTNDNVRVTADGEERFSALDPSGNFSVSFLGSVLASAETVTVEVTATDSAGNSAVLSTNVEYEVDTTPPLALFSTTTFNVNTPTPLITGTVDDASAQVTINVNGINYTTPADGETWSIEVDTPLADGAYTMTVFAVDSVGNTSGVFSAQLNVDAYNPNATITVNNVTADNIVNAVEGASAVLVSGSAEGDVAQGDEVSLTFGATEYTTTLNENLEFSVSVSASVISTHTSFIVEIQVYGDIIGNSAIFSTEHFYTVDMTAPIAPTIELNDDTGSVAGITNNGAFTVTGIEDGSLVEYSINGGDTWSTTVPTAIEGVNEIYVRQTDAAGNVSASNTLEFTLDTIPPSLETVTFDIDPVTADNILNAQDLLSGIINISGEITGDVSVGNDISVTADGLMLGTTLGADNRFTVPFSAEELNIAPAEIIIVVHATDAAGNLASLEYTLDYTVDVVPPTVTVDAFATANASPVITGTLSEDAEVNVQVMGEQRTVSGTASEGWSLDLAAESIVFSEGINEVLVLATDAAGNTSTQADGLIRVSTVAPELTIEPIVVNSAGALSFFTGGTTNLQADEYESLTVRMFPGAGNEISGGFVVSALDYTWEASLIEWAIPTDNFYSDALEVTLVTIYGVTLVVSQDMLVDTTLPDAPTIALVEDTGSVEGITSNGAFTLSGVEEGATVEYSADGGDNWSSLEPVAVEGENEIYVRQKDVAGNTSPNGELIFTLDTTPPIVSIAEFTTADASPVISGTLTENSEVTIQLLGDERTVSGTVAEGWSLDLASESLNLIDGFNVISAFATDNAGNTSSEAVAVVTYNTPINYGNVSLTLDPITADNVINAAEAAETITITGFVSGYAFSGNSLEFVVGEPVYSTELLPGLQFSIDIPGEDLVSSGGTLDITLYVDNGFGNEGTLEFEGTFDIDTTLPIVSVDELYTNNSSPVISGTLTKDAVVTVQVGVGQFDVSGTAADGWTLNLASESIILSEGPNEVLAFATDNAGNEGAEVAANVFVNTTPPELTINPVVVNLLNSLSFNTGGTTDQLAADVASLTVKLFPDTGSEIIIPAPFISDFEWAAFLVEWPVPDDGTYVDGIEVTLTTIYGSTITVYQDVVVNQALPSLGNVIFNIDPVTADNIINYEESMGQITISGKITGAVSIGDEIEIRIDGGEPYFTELDALLGFSAEVDGWELAYASSTVLSIRVFANDVFGNPETTVDSEDIAYVVDLDAPEIVLNTFAVTSLDTYIEGTVDEQAEIVLKLYEIDGPGFEELVTSAGSWWSFNVSSLNLAIGEWDVEITAIDAAGNVGEYYDSVLVIGDPVANDDTYYWLWDGFSEIEILAAQGVLANDTDPQNRDLTVDSSFVLEGNSASFDLFSNGAFTYTPDATDDVLVVSYDVFNGYTYDTATLTLNIRRIEDEAAQACLFVPAQLPANESTTWDIIPASQFPDGATLNVVNSGGMSLFVSGNSATGMPSESAFNGIEFELNYADGRTDLFGPYTIVGKPAFNNAFSVPSLSLANSAELDLVIADDRGGLLAFGSYGTPADPALAEVYVSRLTANGVADDNFGNAGVARIQFPASTISGRVVSSAIPHVQVVKPIGSEWLVGGYVEFHDSAQEITWLAAFMFRMQADGSLSAKFNELNIADELVPWLEESETQDLEIGAIFVRNADDILVARNSLTREVDGDIVRLRPNSYRIIRTTALDAPDLDGTLHSDNGDRVRIIAPVPGGSQLMLVSQHLNAVSADSLAIRRFSTEFSWQQDSTLSPGGTLLPLAGAAGDNPISLYPNIEHYVISEAGILWLSGMGDTEGTNKNKYLVGVDLNRNENDDPIGFYYSNLSTVAAEQQAQGLLLGQDNELFELYSTGNNVYMRRFFEDGSLDVNFYISGIAEKPISDVFPNTVALLNTVRATGSPIGTRFLAVFDNPLDPGNRHPQELNPYAEESLPAFAQNCVIERYNDISDTYTSFSGAAWVNNNLFVGFNQAGWNVAKLIDGENWERGNDRGGFYNLFSLGGFLDLGSIVPDSLGGVIMSGSTDDGREIKRATPAGLEDTLFAQTDFGLSEDTVSFSAQDAGTNRFVVVSLSYQGLDVELRVDRYELNSPNASGEASLSLPVTFDTYLLEDASWGYILDVVFDTDENLYVLIYSQQDKVLKFDSNGNLDTNFGTDGVLILPTSGEQYEQIKGMDLVNMEGVDALIIFEEHEVLVFQEVFYLAALRKFDLTGANENSFDASFGEEGVLLFNSHTTPSDSYFTSKQWVISQDNALFVALVNNSGPSSFAEIAKLDAGGDYIADWGNLGIAPFSDRAQGASSIHSLSFYEGQLYAIWGDSTGFGVTAFLDNGFVDTGKANAGTTKFSGQLGDESVNLAVTPSGKLYLATDWLSFTDSPSRNAVLWGLEYNGSAVNGFGCQVDCYSLDLGAAQMYEVMAKRLFPTNRNKLLFFNNGNNFYGNEPAVLGSFVLNDDQTGLNSGADSPDETIYFTDLFDTSFGTQIEINSVSPFVHDRLLVTGIFDDGFSNERFIMAFDREGSVSPLAYEGIQALNIWYPNSGNFQNGQPQYPVYALESGQGDLWVLMQQTSPERLWWLGRYEQYGGGPDGWVGSNNLGSFAEATAIQLATDTSGNVLVLDQLDDDKRARVFKLDTNGDFINWGTNQGTYYGWVSDDVYEPSIMRVAPDGSVFVGGHTDGNKPVLVRLSSAGFELQRWTGLQLTRADAARVTDIAIDAFGHATVLLDSFVGGGWRAQMVRIPSVY